MITLRKQHRRYEKYRNSGVEWLGQIPEEWETKKLKYSARINPEKLADNTDPTWELEYVDIGNVDSNGNIIGTETFSFEGAPSRARRKVQNDDTIISTVRTYLKAIGYVQDPPNNLVVSTGFSVLRPSAEFDPKYFSRMISSYYFVEPVVSHSDGVSYPAINPTKLATLPVWTPSKKEQSSIATYLDEKCAIIDGIIDKKQRQLELLKEKRAAIINRAVTRGLDEGVEMKESGVEWIGKIPKGWQRRSLRYCTAYTYAPIKTGPFGSDLKGDDFRYDGEFRVYNQRNVLDGNFDEPALFISNDKFKDLQSCELFPNDVLITSRGTIGKTAIFPQHAVRGILHPCLIRITVNDKVCLPDYLKLILQEADYIKEQFILISNGTTIEVIYSNTLKATALLLPSVSGQIEILQYIKTKTSETDQLIQLLEHSLSLLSEYKTSLIAHAVTGRIKVPTTSDV